jgi:hypothetical protein
VSYEDAGFGGGVPELLRSSLSLLLCQPKSEAANLVIIVGVEPPRARIEVVPKCSPARIDCRKTIIVALEDIQDCHAFEAAIIANYEGGTQAGALLLASLLWGMRRVTPTHH